MRISRTVMLGALALLVAAGIILALYPAGKPKSLPRNMESGLIAMESATSPAEVNEIWRLHGLNQANIRPNLKADFGFMAAYGLLYGLLGYVASQRGRNWFYRAGLIAIVAGIATVAFDAAENVHMLKLLRALESGHELVAADAATVAGMRTVSLAKWGLSGITMLLLLGAFTPARAGAAIYRILAYSVAILIALAGIMAIWGVFDNSKIERVMPCLALGLLLFIVLVAKYWPVHLPAKN